MRWQKWFTTTVCGIGMAANGCTSLKEVPRGEYAARPERRQVRIWTTDSLEYELDFARVQNDTLIGYRRRDVQGAVDEFDTLTLPERRLTVYRAMSASPGSGPLTITFTGNQSNAQWIVSQWDGVEITGTNGADAIAQVGSARGDAVTGLSVPLAALANANNVAYGAFGVNKNTVAVTPGPGFTEISEHASGETQAGDLQAEWAVNRNTITASWAASRAGALGLEIKAKTQP